MIKRMLYGASVGSVLGLILDLILDLLIPNNKYLVILFGKNFYFFISLILILICIVIFSIIPFRKDREKRI